MLILAIETTGRDGSIALVRDGVVLALEAVSGGTYSAKLVPLISAMLTRTGVRPDEIDAYAAASGPGSFTGLRVGLSTIKGLAEVMPRPIAAISMLEAMAYASGQQGRILAALDAQRHQIFLGEYERTGEDIPLLSESLLTEAEFEAAMRGAGNAQIVTPDAAIAALVVRAGIKFQQIPAPQADVIARMAADKVKRGQTVSPESLDANYIRRSDAEIFAKK